MAAYKDMSTSDLKAEKAKLEKLYDEKKALGLKLNMARGKPSVAQLELSLPMLDTVNSTSDLIAEDGTDCRNYGCFDGIPEAKALLAAMCGAKPEQMAVFGNSSLNIMFDIVSHAWTHGVCGATPWGELPHVSFICPVPGYDRHFGITEWFGIDMICVPLKEDGPDMDMVEELVKDELVKGIWCVPKYANPNGVVYSDEVVRRFAALKPAAADFRIFWDNAYCVHDLYDETVPLLSLLDECEKAGNPDLAYMFCSTSKVTFPGAGISGLATSKNNLDDIHKQMQWSNIGHDKINQLRHVRFLKDADGIHAQMKKHAAIIRPKFEAVEKACEKELGGLEIGTWTKPRGGYFISFDALPGCAKAIVAKAKEAGVTMTGAGATYPYKRDPADSNIRIAPTLPTPEELTQAAEIFVLCVKLVSIDKILSER